MQTQAVVQKRVEKWFEKNRIVTKRRIGCILVLHFPPCLGRRRVVLFSHSKRSYMDEPIIKDDSLSLQKDPQVISLLKQIQQQLGFLEKKIDGLIAQSSGSSPREEGFAKHRRPFGNSFHHGKPRSFHRSGPGGGGDFYRDREHSSQSSHSDRPRRFEHGSVSGEPRGHSANPLAGGSEQPRRAYHDRPFKKPHGTGFRKPFHAKKKFSA